MPCKIEQFTGFHDTQHSKPVTNRPSQRLVLDSFQGFGISAFSETILKSSRQCFHISHSTCTSGSSSLCLLCPLVGSDLGSRVATCSTRWLLLVEWDFTTSPAGSMCFCMSLTERLSTFSLKKNRIKAKRIRMIEWDSKEIKNFISWGSWKDNCRNKTEITRKFKHYNEPFGLVR